MRKLLEKMKAVRVPEATVYWALAALYGATCLGLEGTALKASMAACYAVLAGRCQH
jgi:hypothetical protein